MELILMSIVIVIIIWFASIYMLSGWEKFKTFFIANGVLIIGYVGFLVFGNAIWGHDEYGLGFLFRLPAFLLTHVLVVFVFAVIKYRQLKK